MAGVQAQAKAFPPRPLVQRIDHLHGLVGIGAHTLCHRSAAHKQVFQAHGHIRPFQGRQQGRIQGQVLFPYFPGGPFRLVVITGNAMNNKVFTPHCLAQANAAPVHFGGIGLQPGHTLYIGRERRMGLGDDQPVFADLRQLVGIIGQHVLRGLFKYTAGKLPPADLPLVPGVVDIPVDGFKSTVPQQAVPRLEPQIVHHIAGLNRKQHNNNPFRCHHTAPIQRCQACRGKKKQKISAGFPGENIDPARRLHYNEIRIWTARTARNGGNKP